MVNGDGMFYGGMRKFGCRRSESGGRIENEFSVLFVTDDVGHMKN